MSTRARISVPLFCTFKLNVTHKLTSEGMRKCGEFLKADLTGALQECAENDDGSLSIIATKGDSLLAEALVPAGEWGYA